MKSSQETQAGPRDYRTSHANTKTVQTYVKAYEQGYFTAQWEAIEKPLLKTIINDLPTRPKNCLDFACGTGRISSALAEIVPTVTGVDISGQMLSEARVPPNVELLEQDITRAQLGKKFDLCTAFRFFLNAQEELRVEALRGIRSHLNDNAYLIANIHMSSSSPMGFIYNQLKRLKGKTVHRTMGVNEFTQLLEENGFSVERVYHYSYLPKPGRYFPRFAQRVIYPFERLCNAVNIPRKLSQNFCVLAKVS
jgi:SAM-dependent methyltransferase